MTIAKLSMLVLAGAAALASNATFAQSANATTAGTPTAPAPTLNNLSVEWPVTGDADNDGVVAVRFRRQGTSAWSQGMPLRRVPAASNEGFSWANRHSGSVFNLEPATTYEIALDLADADGGSTSRTLTATTRAIPAPAANGTVKPVTPASLASVLNNASPGDIITLQPGTYAGFQPTRNGAAGAPITIRGTAGAVITGEVGLFGRAHIYLDRLTVVGRIRFNGSNNISVVGSNVTATPSFAGDAIVAYTRSENGYVADNTVTGLTAWAESSLGVNGNNQGEGILVTGPGNVIARNTVRGFRDGISFMEGTGQAVDQYSIDVIDNVIGESGDDAIEADFCFHNCRIMRNRATNSFIAFSAQPSLGGPTYFIRNSAYNVAHVAFKLYRGSIGDVVLHNTIVKHGDALAAWPGRPISRAYFRNNLLIGGPAGVFNGYESGNGRTVDLATLDAASSMNYDGIGTTLPSFTGRIGAVSYMSAAQMKQLTSESQGRQVDLSVFATAVAFPTSPMTTYPSPSLVVSATGLAADAGEVIPNVNDGYRGAGPDLGAFESEGAAGAPPPPAGDIVFGNAFE